MSDELGRYFWVLPFGPNSTLVAALGLRGGIGLVYDFNYDRIVGTA